jgi:hypothetical protein
VQPMNLQSVLWAEKSGLIQTAHLSVIHGLLDTWKRCRRQGYAPQEPDFVAGMVLESTPLLYEAFAAVFAKYNLEFSLSSVFCHQTPKIRYPGMQKTSCEVGD